MEIFTEDLLEDTTSLFAVEEQIYDGEVNMMFYHHHNHYEIMYMTHDKRLMCIGDRKYELNQNNVALLPPYLAHKAAGMGFYPYQTQDLINFKKEFISDMLPDDSLFSIFNMETHVFEFDNETREKSVNILKTFSRFIYTTIFIRTIT